MAGAGQGGLGPHHPGSGPLGTSMSSLFPGRQPAVPSLFRPSIAAPVGSSSAPRAAPAMMAGAGGAGGAGAGVGGGAAASHAAMMQQMQFQQQQMQMQMQMQMQQMQMQQMQRAMAAGAGGGGIMMMLPRPGFMPGSMGPGGGPSRAHIGVQGAGMYGPQSSLGRMAGHAGGGGGGSSSTSSSSSGPLSITEMQARILKALRDQPGRQGYNLAELGPVVGFPCEDRNDLAISLRGNDKIHFDSLTQRFSYKSKYQLEDRLSLLRLLRQHPAGLPMADLLDAYAEAGRDISNLTRTGGYPMLNRMDGGLIRVRNADRLASDRLFPRPEMPGDYSDLVKLTGTVTVEHGSCLITTTADLTAEIFRNDVIIIGREAYRVSSSAWSATASTAALSRLRRDAAAAIKATAGDSSQQQLQQGGMSLVQAGGGGAAGKKGKKGGGGAAGGGKKGGAAGASMGGQKRGRKGGEASEDDGGSGDDDDSSSDSQSDSAGAGGKRKDGAGGLGEDSDLEMELMDHDRDDSELLLMFSSQARAGAGGGGGFLEQAQFGGGSSLFGGSAQPGMRFSQPSSSVSAAVPSSSSSSSSSSAAASGGDGAAKAGSSSAAIDLTGKADSSASAAADAQPTATTGGTAAAAAGAGGAGSGTPAAPPQPPFGTRAAPPATAAMAALPEEYPDTGVHSVSVGNGTKLTGGWFSVGDTAPHRLKSGSPGYYLPFTATVLPLDRPYTGPSAAGLSAYKVGSTGDVRTLWHLLVSHGPTDIANATGHTGAGAVSSLLDSVLQAQGAAAGAGMAMGVQIGGGAGGASAGGVAAGAEGAAGSSAGAAAATPKPPSSSSASARTGGGIFLGAEGILPRLGGQAALGEMRTFPASHQELRAEMQKVGLTTYMSAGTLGGTVQGQLARALGTVKVKKVRRPNKRALLFHSNAHVMNTPLGDFLRKTREQQVFAQYQREVAAAAADAQQKAAAVLAARGKVAAANDARAANKR